MRRKQQVTLTTNVVVPRHRVDEVLAALHFLEGHGFDYLVGMLYELCCDDQDKTTFMTVAAKLYEEGLIKSYEKGNRRTTDIVIDPVVRVIVLAAVKPMGGSTYDVVRTADKIIRH